MQNAELSIEAKFAEAICKCSESIFVYFLRLCMSTKGLREHYMPRTDRPAEVIIINKMFHLKANRGNNHLFLRGGKETVFWIYICCCW